MTEPSRVQVGLAGWSNPPAHQPMRSDTQSHLAYYADHFTCVEINSSFYKSHQSSTYARWRDNTPALFRFSVKMPKSVTHEGQLRNCSAEVRRFYDAIANLQPKLAVVLVQLPPRLDFETRTVKSFFKRLPRLRGTRLVCEPRHVSWFTPAADDILMEAKVSRVAADPARFTGAENPMGLRRFAYFRWHGAPHLYYSKYSQAQLDAFILAVSKCRALDTWCIFDNTARYAAWDDALQFNAALQKPRTLR